MTLVLERKPGQAVDIAGLIKVRIEKVRGNRVKLSFDAPRDIAIKREELCEFGTDGKGSQ